VYVKYFIIILTFSIVFFLCPGFSYCGVFTLCKNCNIETLQRLRNSRRSGVFSVLSRAEPNRAEPSRTEPSRDKSRIASPRLLPGNSYKRKSEEGSPDLISSDVTCFNTDATIGAFPACQIKGLYERLKLVLEQLSASSRWEIAGVIGEF
jgi:hypothetical protein